MKTTADFLDEIKELRNVQSDYAVAKILGVRHTNLSNYRHGRSHFDAAMCIKVAEVLNVEPAYIMACMEAERAKTDEIRKVWERAAKLLGGIAAGVAIMTAPALGIDLETAPLLALMTTAESSLYIMLN